jgi:hypothetical protein
MSILHFLRVISVILVLGGIKYTKSTIRNQSIIQNSFSLLLDPKWWLINNQQVLKMVDFWKPVNYISVDLPIFDTPYYGDQDYLKTLLSFFMVTLKAVVQVYWIKILSSNSEWSTFYRINCPLLCCFLCRCQTGPKSFWFEWLHQQLDEMVSIWVSPNKHTNQLTIILTWWRGCHNRGCLVLGQLRHSGTYFIIRIAPPDNPTLTNLTDKKINT